MVSSQAGKRIVRRWFEDIFTRGDLYPPRDQRVTESGILIYRIEDGKVKELWSEMSDLQVMQQLGAFPVPKSMSNRKPRC